MTRRAFNGLILALMALGFLLVVIAGGASAYAVTETQRLTEWVTHTYDVRGAIYRYRMVGELSEAARRGYMLAPNPISDRVYAQNSGDILRALDALQRLTGDNPRQLRHITAARRVSREQLAGMNATMRLVHAGRRDEAIAVFAAETGNPPVFRARQIIARMLAEEEALLADRKRQYADSVRLFRGLMVITGLLLLAVAGSSLLILLRYTRDLNRSQADLKRLNDNLERMVDARTAELSRANAEIQRFAYIVSHDLRSPLVNVMGFTAELATATGAIAALVRRVDETAPELVDEDARLAATEDLPEAIGFIRSSTQKMDRLINAILKLSREGRRVIAPERLDMTELVKGIRDSLAHRIAELEGEVRIEKPLPCVVSDRVAMEQVFSNLIENAIKYRHAERNPQVVVRGTREPGNRILYEVEDNGRGIDARDHDRVFDLFRRSGVQDQPGEGIGLAHVRAVVYRLGGTIQVRSVFGEGSVFRISLPAVLAGDQGAPS